MSSAKKPTIDEAWEELLSKPQAPIERYPKDRAELAVESGFTGTLSEFLDWIEDSLIYGGLVRKPIVDSYGRPKVQVDMITGGASSDESLLGRVYRSGSLISAWRSTHAGGLYVYEFPDDWFTSESREWLKPSAGDPFETIYAVRKVRIVSPSGKHIETLEGYENGVELIFDEGTPDGRRDFNNISGILTVRPREKDSEV